ncbi:hypothetical protein, partial [Bacteroides acidifaciens]|uniref:hypothetical protein n=1 Tax=Bacteroides acidifaciens TaxID=85831 RepID=UPI0025771C3E
MRKQMNHVSEYRLSKECVLGIRIKKSSLPSFIIRKKVRNLQRFSSLTRNLLTPLNKKLKKMTKSALQIARAAYQPKLPKALASGA